jgi:hypothetical protein
LLLSQRRANEAGVLRLLAPAREQVGQEHAQKWAGSDHALHEGVGRPILERLEHALGRLPALALRLVGAGR